MFPGSVNSPLHRTGSSNACSPNSVLKLWEHLNARVSMCLKGGDEAADPQSRNSSKIQGHRTATRLWACSITILGWPAFLQHLSIWDLILKWEDHQNNFHNDPTSSGLTVRKRNADRIPDDARKLKISGVKEMRVKAPLLLFGCERRGKSPPLHQVEEGVERG